MHSVVLLGWRSCTASLTWIYAIGHRMVALSTIRTLPFSRLDFLTHFSIFSSDRRLNFSPEGQAFQARRLFSLESDIISRTWTLLKWRVHLTRVIWVDIYLSVVPVVMRRVRREKCHPFIHSIQVSFALLISVLPNQYKCIKLSYTVC